MAPPCAAFDGTMEYRLTWMRGDLRGTTTVLVERSTNGYGDARYTATAGRAQAWSRPSPYVAAYEAACEHLWRLPAETFTLTEVSP